MNAIASASWPAIGTTAHVLVTDAAALEAATLTTHRLLERVDLAYSRFRADSELTALNAAAGRRVRVSALLFAAIETAIRAARLRDGAVDPTIGHVLRLLGYERDFADLPADAPSPRLLIGRVPGWQIVELDTATRTVRLPDHVELDLGSSGKAVAADLAAAAAHAETGAGVLVNLGGDIATAGMAPTGGWPILCSDDSRTDPGSDGEVVAIAAGAIATSSTTVRRWTRGGVVRHHIVDPATGLPAAGPWRTATVVAGTCVDANAGATAAIVLGDRAVEWLERMGLSARLVGRDGDVTRVGKWPQPRAEAA